MKSILFACLLSLVTMPFAWAGDAQSCLAHTAYTITAKGKSVDMKAVSAKLEADPAFADAKCVALKGKKGKTAGLTYSCSNASEKSDAAFRAVVGADMTLTTKTVGCPSGCTLMYCPYPLVQCCNIITKQPCQ